MDEKTRTELALFRFSLIAPLVNGSFNGPAKEYFERVSSKTYNVPGYGPREFSISTLKNWLTNYRRYGLEGLKRQPRSDRGRFRSLSNEAQKFILESLRVSANRPAVAIYHDMLSAKLPDVPSLSTVQRFIKTCSDVEPELERKRYEFEFANDCWQSDICVGPHLLLDGRKKRTYLIALLDDASRLLVNCEFSFQENYLALETVLRDAFLKRGVPKKLFVDNGKIYQSQQMRLICARLGIVLSFTRPYSPASKGKVERVFRTIRGQFLEPLDLTEIDSLERLNQLTREYVEGTYNQRVHSSLEGLSPIDRFLKDAERIRYVDEKKLERAFLHELKRRVSKDATVSLNNVLFEVPQVYCGQQVDILFNPHNEDQVYLKGDEALIPIERVRKIDNSKIPRKQRDAIDYTKLCEGED